MTNFLQTDLPELNFCLQCLSYVEQINSIISPNPDEEPIKDLYFTSLRPGNLPQITDEAIQFINKNMHTDYQPEYIGHENLTTLLVHAVRITMRNRISLSNLNMITYEIKNNLIQNPCPVLDLVCQMGLDVSCLYKKPYHEILYIYLNRIKIIEIIEISDVNLNTLLTLQHNTLVNILDHKRILIDFCKNTNLNLNTLLRANKDLLEYMFNDFKTLQTLTLLYEQYFVDISEILKSPLDEFVSLLKKPHEAAFLHIASTAVYTDQTLLADLGLYVESQLQSIRSLTNGMHMVNLTKLRDHPRQFIVKLKTNYIPFVICSSLYDVLHDINSKICTSYMAYFQHTDTKSPPKTFSYNQDSIQLHPDSALNKVIISMLDNYISESNAELARAFIGLDSFMQKTVINFAPDILKHDLLFLQAEYTINQLEDACKLIQDLYQKLKKSLSVVRPDAISAKHLCVILSLSNCNAAKIIVKTKPNNTKLLVFAKETIRNLAGYMDKTCSIFAETNETDDYRLGRITTQSNSARY